MSNPKSVKDTVVISKEIWEWARKNPAFSELIEMLEDLEDLKRAKSEKGHSVLISDVIEQYEKSHGTKLDV